MKLSVFQQNSNIYSKNTWGLLKLIKTKDN